VDSAGFEKEMQRQRERSKQDLIARRSSKSGTIITLTTEHSAVLENKNIPATDDSPKYNWLSPHQSSVAALVANGQLVSTFQGPGTVGIVLKSTSFYAEGGGQVC
jgi:alanyl-tRNA synthetase